MSNWKLHHFVGKMQKLAILIFLCLLSCKEQATHADLIKKAIEKGTDSTQWRRYENKHIVETITSYHNGKLMTIVSYDSVFINRPRKIYSYFIGKRFGHDFHFDSEGKVDFYSYKIGQGENSSYIRHYDSTSQLSKEEGSILVAEIKDTSGVTCFFTTAFHDSIKVEVLSDDNTNTALPLKVSQLLPMLLETHLKNKNDTTIFLKTHGYDRETSQACIFSDTIILKNGKVYQFSR